MTAATSATTLANHSAMSPSSAYGACTPAKRQLLQAGDIHDRPPILRRRSCPAQRRSRYANPPSCAQAWRSPVIHHPGPAGCRARTYADGSAEGNNEMIYSPEISARIIDAMQSITLGNNGYADIGPNETIADACRAAGFVVIRSTNLHGRPTYKGFTKAAQEALRGEPYAVSTYKPIEHRDDFDYEGAILARQERAMMDY